MIHTATKYVQEKMSFPRNFVFQEMGYKPWLTGRRSEDEEVTKAGIQSGVQGIR